MRIGVWNQGFCTICKAGYCWYFLNQSDVSDYIFIYQLTMTVRKYLIFCTILFITVSQSSQNSPNIAPCLSFLYGNCVACPNNYHLYQKQCYLNIIGCLSYTNSPSGIQLCTKCDSNISLSDGKGSCTLTVSPQDLANMNYYGSLISQYGNPSFYVIPLNAALNDSNFQIVNQFMLKGQYNLFISKTPQPVKSVATYTDKNVYNYKILYLGSGGGLMMCIISLDKTTGIIRISSFVQIAAGGVINYCQLYGSALQCLQCGDGYHLENGVCYANIGDCVSYSQNICLQCEGFAILVENRCISDCRQADLSQIPFFGDFRLLLANTVRFISRSYLLH